VTTDMMLASAQSRVMKGYIYIAGSFDNVNRSACGQGDDWIDNDPHFWTSPPTWGICRPDLREKVDEDDVIFFVLPAQARHPQMVFGYLTVADIITHSQAYAREDLESKRMGNKSPNGNILVDEFGRYNRYDANAHRDNFDRIQRRYVVADPSRSLFLTERQIRRLAPDFLAVLSRIMGRTADRPIDLISRYGAELNPHQIEQLKIWLATA
jgi:hypothetical protein